MDILPTIPDFDFSTELNEAHTIFGEYLGIIAYVEACDGYSGPYCQDHFSK